HYENVYFLGVMPEFTAQHQEANDGDLDIDNTYGTRFRFNLTAGSVWYDIQRDYRFGPIRIENLTFMTETRHGIFRLGDDGDGTGGSFRGFIVKNCIFS